MAKHGESVEYAASPDPPPKDAGGMGGALAKLKSNHALVNGLAVLAIFAVFAGAFLWLDMDSKVYIEKAEISAPVISISPSTPGVLEKFYVQEGDYVSAGQKLALVGGQPVFSQTSGLIIGINNVPGQFVSQQTPILRMLDPRELRLVGSVQEDKGLNSIKPGQRVVFTVDAFGSRQFEGTVDSVALSAKDQDIVFSISDKRQVREFDVRVLFNGEAYPEIKNGMSARMWVYKQ